MAKKNRMKNGLDMLFEDNYHEDSGSEELPSIRISLIEPDRTQPRKAFDEQKLRELSDNIAMHGVLQPILVRPLENGGYRIVAGERRWRAARMAGLSEIPAVVKELSDSQAAQISLIENIQREDLDPIEEAQAYQRLMDEFGMTQQQLADAVGKSRAGIANSTRMLKLPEEVRQSVAQGLLSVGHAKLLCGIEDKQRCIELNKKCIEQSLTVRQLENELARSVQDKPKTVSRKTYSEFEKNAVSAARQLKDVCGLNADIKREGAKKYTVKFTFGGEGELMDFINKLDEK